MLKELSQIDLQWIRTLSTFRTPFFNSFFLVWNEVDGPLFAIALIVFVWYGVNWRWGARLFYLTVINQLINHSLKLFFALPRPCQIDSSVGLICSKGYGFPSGAAQSAVLLAGLFIVVNHKKRWGLIAGIAFWLVFSFSRMYLGVHFFTDIVGGWVVGAILLVSFLRFGPRIEKQIKSSSYAGALLLTLLIPCIQTIMGWSLALQTLGVSTGIWLGNHFKTHLKAPITWRQSITRIIVASGPSLSIALLLRLIRLPYPVFLALCFVLGILFTIITEVILARLFKTPIES